MAAPVPAAPDAPVDLGEFSDLLDGLGPFERHPALAVAVSGGADSMALALLARDWAAARDGSLLALIVDHGLRAESAAEAALTAGRLAEAGIASRILPWIGAKPATGIQAAARAVRYRLLQDACRTAGILHLLLAHHADDQAETVAMRRQHGSGPDGLAGMAAVREVEDLRLLRPLLGIAKARLAATLRRRGVAWIEDPSNRDPRFARGRLRLAGPPPAVDPQAGAARAAREHGLAAFMAARARPHPLGFVRLDMAGLAGLPVLALERLLVTVAGGTLPPRRRSLERLAALLSPGDAAATLAGCILRRRGDLLLVLREPRAAAEAVEIRPGQCVRWDGRFRIALAADAPGGLLRRLGGDGRAALGDEARGRAAVPALAQLALPSLWREGRLAWHPLLPRQGMAGAVSCGFSPPVGLAGAAFLPANVVSNGDPLIYRQG